MSCDNIMKKESRVRKIVFREKFSLANEEWFYRGEGNANIAISIPQCQLVLRIAKDDSEYKQRDEIEKLKHSVIYKPVSTEDLNLQFYSEIISPLIGKEYARPAISVVIPADEISKLNSSIFHLRPESRRNKFLELSGKATLFEDYALLPKSWQLENTNASTFAVEIKPKFGFYTSEDAFLPFCIFCAKQFTKLKNQSIPGISTYCPCDLFSGKSKRMRSAIIALLHNPQNNFSIFKDGIRLYGENVECDYKSVLREMFPRLRGENDALEEFCSLMLRSLKHTFDVQNVHKCRYPTTLTPNDVNVRHFNQRLIDNAVAIPSRQCDFSRRPMPRGCVLEKIYSAQQLHRMLVVDLYRTYDRRSRFGYVEDMVRIRWQSKQETVCSRCFVGEQRSVVLQELASRHRLRPNDEVYRKIRDLDVCRYLVSAVAADCSFMVTFQPIDMQSSVNIPDHHIITTNSGTQYAVSIGVFDLFPKPINCIKKHFTRNKDLYERCLQSNGL